MLYYSLAIFTSIYSVLAITLVLAYFSAKRVYGTVRLTELVNKFAKTKKIVAFKIYSYLALVAWVALAMPWIDLFTVGWFTQVEEGGLHSYFGWMSGKDADFYFFLVFFNILGAKAAVVLGELAGLLRKGRVRMLPHGGGDVWTPER